MTTIGTAFRIRRQGMTWLQPGQANDFPCPLEYEISHPQTTGFTGMGQPNGAFGYPEVTLKFPPIPETDWSQVSRLLIDLPTGQSYVPVEVELVNTHYRDPATGYPSWRVYLGNAVVPFQHEQVKRRLAGRYIDGLKIRIVHLVDNTTT